MKRAANKDPFPIRNLSEKERFDLFYQSILVDGKIMFAGRLLQRSYEYFANNIALIYKDRFVSYKELYHRACIMSEKLKSLGIQKTDKIILFLENSIEFYIAYFGIWQIGSVVVPLNIFLQERELHHIVHDSQPKLIITAYDKLKLFSDFNIPILTERDINVKSALPNELSGFEIVDLNYDELAALLYTSGTTGLPKGVMLSSKNILTNVVQALSVIPLDQQQKIFCILPLFHCFAQNTCVWSSLFAGCSVVIVPKITRGRILEGLQHKPTIFLGVPALYGLLCLFKNLDLSSVNYFISGGDALPDKIRLYFSLIYGRKLCNGYGLTETSPLISVDFDDITGPTNNIGYSVIGLECKIKDNDGNELSDGLIGELWIKGDNIMMGYYNAPEKTKDVIVNGWLKTGDLAKFDKNRKLIICGRIKDIIIQKGLNIYPQEIENLVIGHPNVLYVGVIGKEDESYGQIPIAVIQLRNIQSGIEEDLRDLCKKNLASYKVPRQFIVIKEMPLTATSKVDKNKLREMFS